MATVSLVWERTSGTFLGGAKPNQFKNSTEANTAIQRFLQHGADAEKPKKVFDVVTVTV